MPWFIVEVDLAVKRPPTVQVRKRYYLHDECCAHHAELTGIYWGMLHTKAAMPVGSRILDWEKDENGL